MISDINKSILGFEISLAVSTNIKEKLLKRLAAIVSEAQGWVANNNHYRNLIVICNML